MVEFHETLKYWLVSEAYTGPVDYIIIFWGLEWQ